MTTVTDCQSKSYTFAYTSGKLTSLTTPPLSGQTYSQQMTYDSNNNVASLADVLGRTWGYGYTGNVLSSTTLARQRRRWLPAYRQAPAPADGSPWPANVTTLKHWHDANGNITQYGLDNLNRVVGCVDASSNISVYTYDNSHNRTATQLPSGKTFNSTFDTWGNELISQDPLGHQTVKTVDGPSGRLLTSTDASAM